MLSNDPIVPKSNAKRDSSICERLFESNGKPGCDVEKANRDEFKQTKPPTDKELSAQQGCCSEIGESNSAKPNVESAKSKRPKIRTGKVEPRNTKSWMESENA